MAKYDMVMTVLEAYGSGNLDPTREDDMVLIAKACRQVRDHEGDAALCTPIDPTSLTPGMAICFKYGHPGANGSWRFGIVTSQRTASWIVYTLNLKRERIRGGGGRMKTRQRGPGYRCYHLNDMSDTHLVTAPRGETADDGKKSGKTTKKHP